MKPWRYRRAMVVRDRDGRLLDALDARLERMQAQEPDRRVTREGLVRDLIQDYLHFLNGDPPPE